MTPHYERLTFERLDPEGVKNLAWAVVSSITETYQHAMGAYLTNPTDKRAKTSIVVCEHELDNNVFFQILQIDPDVIKRAVRESEESKFGKLRKIGQTGV